MSNNNSDLLYPDIVKDVGMVIMSESAGMQLFAVPERLARKSSEKNMWAALHELETQTHSAVFEMLGDEAHRFIPRDKVAAASGVAAGMGLAALPRRLRFYALAEGTRVFVPRFQKLANHFNGTQWGPFFQYVLEHELAIADMSRRALAHDLAFLAPIENLLGQIPEITA